MRALLAELVFVFEFEVSIPSCFELIRFDGPGVVICFLLWSSKSFCYYWPVGDFKEDIAEPG